MRLFVRVKGTSPFLLNIDGSNYTIEQLVDFVQNCYNELYDYRGVTNLTLLRVCSFRGEDKVLFFDKEGGDDGEGGARPTDPSVQEYIPIYSEPEESARNPVCAAPPPGTLTQNFVIKVASLNRLLLMLTSPDYDNYMIDVFFNTYRTFTSPRVVLEKLIQRFSVPYPEGPDWATRTPFQYQFFLSSIKLPIQVTICKLMQRWIENYLFDFDADMVEIFKDFVQYALPAAGHIGLANTLYKSMFPDSSCPNPNRILVSKKDFLSISEFPMGKRRSLLEFSDRDIAEQLTLMDWELYKEIRFVELIGQCWNKEEKRFRAPNVMLCIERFNIISNWVSFCILNEETLRARIKVFSRFVQILDRLRELNSFNMIFAVNSGLNQIAVHRLKHTHGSLKPDVAFLHKDILKLIATDANFRSYREYLSGCTTAIPYLGVCLKDLTFIEDGNPKFLDGMVNFMRCIHIYNVQYFIRRFQLSSDYSHLTGNREVIAYLNSFREPVDERKLYAMSLKREPRNVTKDKLK